MGVLLCRPSLGALYLVVAARRRNEMRLHKNVITPGSGCRSTPSIALTAFRRAPTGGQ